MAYSLQKSVVAKVVGASLFMLLAACTSDQRYKRQVNGNEDYLQAPALSALNSPSGMILPVENGDYEVPPGSLKGQVGKELDVRPPAQPLALLDGSRSQYSGDTAVIQIENSAQARDLWSRVVGVVQSKGYTIASRQDADQTLNTDWVQWSRADEDVQYRGRYQVSLRTEGYQTSLMVKSLALEQQNNPVAAPAMVQRYTVSMLNSVAQGLEQLNEDQDKSRISGQTADLSVESGADDSGLPLLVVRSSYAVVWQHLPSALDKIGMKVKDTSRPLGTISVTYDSPSSGTWDDLGAKDPGLVNGDYKLQVGDLGNRSTLQFTDPKGHTLTQSQNDALVQVFQAALSKSSTH
ncbi:outer membrane protein assembly factor BamC [Sodalis ligni]|jgi:outer membrane protein assembly factor BamC|uniref:Outer membrane protein assembly factor BamC n=1 Tax=Sodalis ligni TaxID=2697027 RepID=A0A4R1NM50_9GAMM|nr:outer membrane protein assembly factor BamC [Sodalis ligni]QWA09652.1 outer membrane protein assembly factor BamC [Sodalis ligni]TCL07071.1 Beta-barrel assembly machine subunit BamC [Sodalis ligni]